MGGTGVTMSSDCTVNCTVNSANFATSIPKLHTRGNLVPAVPGLELPAEQSPGRGCRGTPGLEVMAVCRFCCPAVLGLGLEDAFQSFRFKVCRGFEFLSVSRLLGIPHRWAEFFRPLGCASIVISCLVLPPLNPKEAHPRGPIGNGRVRRCREESAPGPSGTWTVRVESGQNG